MSDDDDLKQLLELLDAILKGSNPFQEHHLINDSAWMTVSGDVIQMRDMSTPHIINCINLLESSDPDYKSLKAYQGLKRELSARNAISLYFPPKHVIMSHEKDTENRLQPVHGLLPGLRRGLC